MPDPHRLDSALTHDVAPILSANNFRRTAARRRREELDRLNGAYCELTEEERDDVHTLLDLRANETSVYKMRPAKRQKMKRLFSLLAKCDDELRELAQGAIEEEEEEEGAVATPSVKLATSHKSYTVNDFARSGKCVCGAKTTHDEMLEAKKVVGAKIAADDIMKGKKVVEHEDCDGKMLKGKKAPLGW